MEASTSSLLELEPVNSDLRKAFTELDRDQARYLVDLFYETQHYRIALGEQIRSLSKSEEPHGTLVFFKEQQATVENQIKRALDTYSNIQPLGKWARSQIGIGPVIAAGLLAHIDISIVQTAGQIWRFAGLDPTVKWYGAKNGDELVKAAFNVESDDTSAMYWLSRAMSKKMEDLYTASAETSASRSDARKAVVEVTGTDEGTIADLFDERPLHTDNALEFACEQFDIDPLVAYKQLYGSVSPDKKALVRFISRRPWNAKLKTLCWKIGESFTKQSGNEKCYYGHMYIARKEYEQKKNEAGDYADQAAQALEEKNYGKDTDARKWYEKGMLPPARIQLRCQRYSVKLFLAHYFEVGYELYNEEKPPAPYPIAHLGHAHYLSPPGPSAAELKAA